MIPLLWLKTDYAIAKGDYFPFWMKPATTSNTDFYLWTSENMGNSNSYPPTLLYGLIWSFFRYLGFTTSSVQFLFLVFFSMGAGLTMYFLSKTVYPKLRLSPLISGIFYMFNFFVLQSMLNIGFAWTYMLLPLLITFLIKSIEATYQQGSKKANKNIIYFAVTSTVTLSLASINPSNVIIILLVLAIIILYYLLLQREQIRSTLLCVLKLALISIPLNFWWAIPTLNYYIWSPSVLNPQVNVADWAWTHSRASFINLFWLNGFWGWRPEYFTYYYSYSNPILIVLTFVPFLLAAVALLFRRSKSSFNAFIMFFVLIFIFLAKGLHEPFGQLNLLLYTYIPGMTMFREPASKFTMALVPFLALLVGDSVDHIANIKISKFKPTNLTKTLAAIFFITIFIIAAYPLVTNPIETKTQQLPFSSYVKIPDYWYQATDWLDNQQGDYKILITPPDDFYQMPYTWRYYGTDQFLERLIQKPIISTYYVYSYKTNPDVTLALQQLQCTIKCNRTTEFKAFLDLLNIKYILQRNDVYYNFTGRNIISPNEMQTFFTQQPYIHLAQEFGQLDIYKYIEHKPYMYTLNQATLQQARIRIENKTALERTWNFNSSTDLEEWQNTTPQNQFGANQSLTLDNETLKAELWNSTWGWKTINSPFLPARFGNIYEMQIDTKGQNTQGLHIKMAEYNANKKILTATYLAFVNEGTFNWTHTTFNFEPVNQTTEYIQIQIWHGHETNKSLPNIIWIDNVQICGYTKILNTTGLDLIFQNTTQSQPATILDYQKINPTKITATINATQPFILAISEALDQSWKAQVNGKQIENTPLYLGLKGFHINQTGLLEITIEYEPQRWFFYGSIISVATLLACLIYLTYNWTKNKAFWKRIETILRAR
jgi:hypothetical protein